MGISLKFWLIKEGNKIHSKFQDHIGLQQDFFFKMVILNFLGGNPTLPLPTSL